MDNSTFKQLPVGASVEQYLAGIYLLRCSSAVRKAITESNYAPCFKTFEGKVYLTYGDRIIIDTKTSETDFMDWANGVIRIIDSISNIPSPPTIDSVLFTGH